MIVAQQIKAHFEGKSYKKAVFVTVIPFNKETIDTGKLDPFFHDDYMKKRDAGAFVYDINAGAQGKPRLLIGTAAQGGWQGQTPAHATMRLAACPGGLGRRPGIWRRYRGSAIVLRSCWIWASAPVSRRSESC